MRSGTRIFRLSVWLASSALTLTGLAPAYAQPAPPPGAADPGQGGDPPALAGRIARLRGTVSAHGAGETNWHPAQINLPVTTGDALWTDTRSDAAIDVGGDRIVLAGATELDMVQLDQANFVATAAQGAIFLRLHDLPDSGSLTINTPRAAIQITQPGRYEVVAGDSANATTVTVVEGAARVQGNGLSLDVGPNSTASITGDSAPQGLVLAMQQDGFLSGVLREEAPRPHAAPPPPAVQYMTGGEDLDEAGDWTPSPEYGQVWFPHAVPADWAPYRFGHWAFIAPWGWTWVDDAPWGFAPFHYGRWVQWGGRWGWVASAPGVVFTPGVAFVRPVYAPALVAFVGLGVGIGIGVGGVGWVPLGFGEPFRPWYHASPRYFQTVNRVNVTNINNYTVNNITINHYANAAAATQVPAAAMQGSRSLGRVAQPLPAAALAHATPVVGQLPVRPTATTAGVTPAVAHSFGLPPTAHVVTAPGPQIHPGMVAAPALRPANPVAAAAYSHPLAAAAAAGAVGGAAALAAHHAMSAAPAAPMAAHPAGGLPPLVPHGQAGVRPASPAMAPGGFAPHALPGGMAPHAAMPGAMAPHATAPHMAAPEHQAMPAVQRPSSGFGAPAYHPYAQPESRMPAVQQPERVPQPSRPSYTPPAHESFAPSQGGGSFGGERAAAPQPHPAAHQAPAPGPHGHPQHH